MKDTKALETFIYELERSIDHYYKESVSSRLADEILELAKAVLEAVKDD